MGNLAKDTVRSKSKGDTSKVNLSSIPEEFFSAFSDGNLSPTELSRLFGVKKRTIRKWKQTIREDIGFQKQVEC